MVRKYIRLNYFELKLVSARVELARDLQAQNQEPDIDNGVPYMADSWDMSGLLNHLSTRQNGFSTYRSIGDEFADIEPDSYIYDRANHLHSFQLSKCRETNIPSKKKLGQIKEEILLEDDEFIGEFTSIIYDPSLNVVAVQSNFYGLTVSQIERYLTEIRFQYLDETGRTEEEPLLVRLHPIMDFSKLDNALGAHFYRKIKIRASDAMLDTTLSENSLLSDAREALCKACGVNIEMQISIGRSERTASLNNEEIRRALHEFRELPGSQKPKIELTMLENEESEIEIVNLIEPRMTDRVSVELEPRATIAHPYLYEVMLSKYRDRINDVRRVLIPDLEG